MNLKILGLLLLLGAPSTIWAKESAKDDEEILKNLDFFESYDLIEYAADQKEQDEAPWAEENEAEER